MLGAAALMVRIQKIGSDGWILVSVAENAPGIGIGQGEKHWINVNQVVMISGPFGQPSQ